MPRTSLTRRVPFAASHRARRPDWSDQDNVDVFGACAHPSYHGYRIDPRHSNLDGPEFGNDRLIPTGEHLSRFLGERVQRAHTTAVVICVHRAADTTLSSPYEVDA